MQRHIALILRGAGIFLLGAFTATIVIWRLNENGLIFTRTEIPNPVLVAADKGHYDEAMKLALADIHEDSKDYSQYHELVYVCLLAAYKDQPNREKWVAQSVSYLDRVVSLAPDDAVNLLEAANEYEKAGDLSKNGCSCYAKGEKLCERLSSLLAKDSLMVRDFKTPTTDLQKENKGLQSRFAKKLQAWCAAGD
ncbi:MAG: hypothetical protein ACRD5M_08305 [Candidatus Acidiferrales bacterium]